jgi:hypothetical protein
MCNKATLLLAAIFALATTGQAQNEEQRPALAPNNSRAADSGDHSRFMHDPDSWDLTLPFQVGPVINGS